MSKYFYHTFIGFFLALSILSCNPKSSVVSSSPTQSQDLTISNIEWQLVTIGSENVKSNTTIFFDLESHKFKGKAPCNSFGGIYTKQGENIVLSSLFSTEMACEDLKTESLFFKALEKSKLFTIKQNTLIFYSKKNVVELKFYRPKK